MSICQIYDLCAETLWLGRYGENGARDIAIDVGKWFADLGTEGTVVLVNWRPGEDDTPYNPNVTMDGSRVVWSPSSIDLAISGRGFAELRYYIGNALAKSKTFRTVIDRTPSEGANPPSAGEDWLERMEDAAVTAQTASETAVDAAETATEGAQAVAQALPTVTQAAQTATSAAATATNAATEAAASEEVASAAANAAQTASETATAASQTAVSSATTATTKATQAVEAAGTATTKASEATQAATTATANAQTSTAKAGEATTAAATATSKATEATTAASTASAAATTATGAASTATSAASTATAAKTAAQAAQTGAETAQAAAEQAAASVTASAEQIETNKQDITELKADFLQNVIYDTASGSVATFSDGAHDLPCKSVVAQIEPKQSGSGDPSPDNVRPISGWDAVQVTRAGKNLYNSSTIEAGYINVSGEVIDDHASGHSTAIAVNVGSTYTLSGVGGYGAGNKRIHGYDANGSWVQQIAYIPNIANGVSYSTSFTIPSGIAFIKISIYEADTYVQIEVGSTATEYEAYNATTYPVTLPQTVYGGEVDVVSGEGKVTYGMVDLGTLNWIYRSPNGGQMESWLPLASAKNGTPAICENYTNKINASGWADIPEGYFHIRQKTLRIATGSSYTDATTFKQAMSGVLLVYELATPTDFSVTPQEVPTLYGSNTIYADSGDVAVEYPADTKLYLSRLTEPDSDMIADANIVSGKYFMVGNDLYLATANIANGGAITPGTNCTKVSLATALNAINS